MVILELPLVPQKPEALTPTKRLLLIPVQLVTNWHQDLQQEHAKQMEHGMEQLLFVQVSDNKCFLQNKLSINEIFSRQNKTLFD